MLISQVIDMARNGELDNLSEDNFTDAKILSYINLGMIELYKRFELRSAEAIITMAEGKTLYSLDGSDTDVAVDTTADIMVIQEAYDESGAWLAINEEEDEYGIMTPSFNQVQIPNPADGQKIGILYVAGPEYIIDTATVLKAPVSLLEALLHYIGYRAHGAVNGNIDGENNTHYQRFEASTARVKQLGLVTSDNVSDRAVYQKGFL